MKRNPRRKAFTLLEVILALAILVGSLAVIGELGRLGLMNARRSHASAVAQLYCESKLAEITSGIVTPSAVTGAPLEVDPEWVYSVAIEPTSDTGLIAVRVTVAENVPPGRQATEFTLVRWMPESVETGESGESSDNSKSGSGSSSGSSTSGGPSSGGSAGASS